MEKHSVDKEFPATQMTQPEPEKKETKPSRSYAEMSPFERQLNAELQEAGVALRGGIFSNRFDTREKMWLAIKYAKENFPKTPITALKQIAIIKGSPAMFGELPLAKAQASGKLKHFRNYVIDKTGKEICRKNENLTEAAYAGVCEIQRDGENLEEYVFTVEQAKKAGLWGRTSKSGEPSPWVLYPERMLKMRARSEALKDKFADALSGIAIAEYDYNMTGEEVEVADLNKVVTGSPDELNQKFLGENKDKTI